MMPFVVFQSLWNAVTRVVTLFYVVLGGSVLVSRAGSILVSGEGAPNAIVEGSLGCEDSR